MVVGCIIGVAGLTGFSYKKMYGSLTGTKKNGGNNKVGILTV